MIIEDISNKAFKILFNYQKLFKKLIDLINFFNIESFLSVFNSCDYNYLFLF